MNNAIFPLAMWNVFGREMEFRTNNHVESYHNRYIYIVCKCYFVQCVISS